MPNGSVAAMVTRTVAGTETVLGTSVALPGVTLAANDKLKVRVQAVSNNHHHESG